MPGINIIITRLVGAAEYPFPFVVLARNFRLTLAETCCLSRHGLDCPLGIVP